MFIYQSQKIFTYIYIGKFTKRGVKPYNFPFSIFIFLIVIIIFFSSFICYFFYLNT